MSARWAGVDVGASKGFDVAVIDGEGVAAGPERITGHREAVEWLRQHRPRVVAVDSPRSPAPGRERSRIGERELVRAGVCGIRYTPNSGALDANEGYYAWIFNGFRLYDALDQAAAAAGWDVVECFPTAAWSRLGGVKGRFRTRAQWSRTVLGGCGLAGVRPRMNQDCRDAIGAALTARLYDRGQTESYGEIIVPRAPQEPRRG